MQHSRSSVMEPAYYGSLNSALAISSSVPAFFFTSGNYLLTTISIKHNQVIEKTKLFLYLFQKLFGTSQEKRGV
jgi:hypothetical protein